MPIYLELVEFCHVAIGKKVPFAKKVTFKYQNTYDLRDYLI